MTYEIDASALFAVAARLRTHQALGFRGPLSLRLKLRAEAEVVERQIAFCRKHGLTYRLDENALPHLDQSFVNV